MSSISGSGSSTINPLLTTQPIVPAQQTTTATPTTVYLDFGVSGVSSDLLGIQSPRSPEDGEMLLMQILEAAETLSDKARNLKIESIANAMRGAISALMAIKDEVAVHSDKIVTDNASLAAIKTPTDTYNSAMANVASNQSLVNAYQGQINSLNAQKQTAIDNNAPQSTIDSLNQQIATATSNRDTAVTNRDNAQGQANAAANTANAWLASNGGAVTRAAGQSDASFAAAIMAKVATQTNSITADRDNSVATTQQLQAIMLNVFVQLTTSLVAASLAAGVSADMVDVIFSGIKDKVEDIPETFKGTSTSIWTEGSSTNNAIDEKKSIEEKIRNTALALVAGISEVFNVLATIDGLSSQNSAGMEAVNNRFRLSI